MNAWIDLLLIAIAPASLTWLYAGLAWSGRYRRWVRASATVAISPFFVWHKRNYWPFLIGILGFTWILFVLGLALLELLPTSPWIPIWVLGFAGLVTVVFSSWWPEAWRPQWHKDWVARGGDRDRTGTPLYSDEELIARGELPPGAAEKIQRQQERVARKKRR